MKKAIGVFLAMLAAVLCIVFLLLLLGVPRGQALEAMPSQETAALETEPSLPLETEPALAPEFSETDPAFAWELPAPENIPASSKNAAVTYRPVHETVYCVSPLYIRSGPGSQYEIIGKLSRGELVHRGAVGNNGWSQILYGSQEAYVNSTYLSVSPIDPREDPFACRETDEILYSRTVTKLRSGPGPDYGVVGHLTEGSGTRRVAAGENGWSRVIFHDTEVYACTAALTYEKSGGPELFVPGYAEGREKVYAAANISIFPRPGFQYDAEGLLCRGESIIRTAIGNNGWSRVLYEGKEAYIPTGYLTREPAPPAPAIETSPVERPTPGAPFLYQYIAPEDLMPYALFTPAEADLSEPLPLIISLHGALEIGEAPETLKSNFITKEMRNWEYTGLQSFDAYIVCPQLTGNGYAETWRCPESADRFFALLEHLKKTCRIDESRIILEGHSLGGQGALYMAADDRACFSAVVPVSAYTPNVSCGGIRAAVRGYNGSPFLPPPREDWDSYHFMQGIFSEFFGPENLQMRNCSHYDIPMVAFEEDLDQNGQSDLIEWMLAQQVR